MSSSHRSTALSKMCSVHLRTTHMVTKQGHCIKSFCSFPYEWISQKKCTLIFFILDALFSHYRKRLLMAGSKRIPFFKYCAARSMLYWWWTKQWAAHQIVRKKGSRLTKKFLLADWTWSKSTYCTLISVCHDFFSFWNRYSHLNILNGTPCMRLSKLSKKGDWCPHFNANFGAQNPWQGQQHPVLLGFRHHNVQ